LARLFLSFVILAFSFPFSAFSSKVNPCSAGVPALLGAFDVDAEPFREGFEVEFGFDEPELDLVSRRIVTGPSLHSETFIIAANFPSRSVHQNTDKKRSVGIDQDRLTLNSTCGNATQT
jgi:hypothetical protein